MPVLTLQPPNSTHLARHENNVKACFLRNVFWEGEAGEAPAVNMFAPSPPKTRRVSFTVSKTLSRRGFGGEGWGEGDRRGPSPSPSPQRFAV